jgi:hypothetical protein
MVHHPKDIQPTAGQWSKTVNWWKRTKEADVNCAEQQTSTVSQLTVQYNIGAQRPIKQRTTRRTLTQMGNGSQRPLVFNYFQQNNKKLRFQWAKERKHWRIGKHCLVWVPGSCSFKLMGGLGYGQNHMSTVHASIMPCFDITGCCLNATR